MIQVCSTKNGAKAIGLVATQSLQKLSSRFEHPISWYGNPKMGLTGQSNRVMLKGGLSPLRWTRTTISEPASLNLASAGQSGFSMTNASKVLGSLPPKNWMFGRRYVTDSSGSAGSGDWRGSSRFSSTLSPKAFGTNNIQLSEGGNSVNGGQGGPAKQPFLYRSHLKHAKRIVIKMGSAVITRADGNGLALGRLASIVEQVAELQNAGHECIIITSGAVAFGKQKLSQELMMSMSMRDTLQHHSNTKEEITSLIKSSSLKKPNAAVGQSGLQALYETMFRNYGILVGQVLVTKPDFYYEETRAQLFTTIQELMQLNIIPIINTNDAVSPPPTVDEDAEGTLGIKDNDSLAARIAVEISADLAILMSDVDGIYNKPPKSQDARLMHNFVPSDYHKIEFGAKSESGTGGMESKVKSALWALEKGSSVVICNGMKYNTIRNVMEGAKIGSFFTKAENQGTPVEVMAQNARSGSRKLQSLSAAERAEVIRFIADALVARQDDLLKVNKLDLDRAAKAGIKGPMYSRLALTPNKIASLADGIRQIAASSHENVGKVLRRTKVSDTLDLEQKTVPIGVLMVIFESRPDALPQVASLAIASANGLLLKGGKEASQTNEKLMAIVSEALGNFGCADAISMVSTREAIGDLLKMEQYIDLIIPRGSGELVKTIKQQSKFIPVLGHAEGICHVYMDKCVDAEKASRIILDSKTDYPSACNAMETLLVHEELLHTGQFDEVCAKLKAAGVTIYAGPSLSQKLTFGPPEADTLKFEYGDMACTIEIVKSVYEAIDHIHRYGSSHTDVVISEDPDTVRTFQDSVDSACVFANCSSRMSDGYRLGLGAEVGISTARIHARGPVGVEGLLTTKWVLSGHGDTAQDYASGDKKFRHQSLPVVDVVTNMEEEDGNRGGISHLE